MNEQKSFLLHIGEAVDRWDVMRSDDEQVPGGGDPPLVDTEVTRLTENSAR